MTTTTQAIIAYPPTVPETPNLKLEDVFVRELKDDEVLVKMLASGVCQRCRGCLLTRRVYELSQSSWPRRCLSFSSGTGSLK
jgi:hypothetical protein